MITYGRDRATDKWIELTDPPAANESLSLTVIVAVPVGLTTPIPLDAEYLILFAAATLFQSYTPIGASSNREDDLTQAVSFRQQADLRRQQLVMALYPPPPDDGKKKK